MYIKFTFLLFNFKTLSFRLMIIFSLDGKGHVSVTLTARRFFFIYAFSNAHAVTLMDFG
jgi:hypothetical protein